MIRVIAVLFFATFSQWALADNSSKIACEKALLLDANPLIADSLLENGHYPQFDKIRTKHFIPAIKSAIRSARKIGQQIKQVQKPTFENVILPLERISRELSRTGGIMEYYSISFADEEFRAMETVFRKHRSRFLSELYSDRAIMSLVKKVSKNQTLNAVQKRLVQSYLEAFEDSGSTLSEAARKRFMEISTELSRLTQKFGENVLMYTNNSSFLVGDESELAGLSPSTIKLLKEKAESRGMTGFLVTLEPSVLGEILEYSKNPELRKKVWFLYNRRAYESGDTDNTQLAYKIASLRREQAELLGYRSHAERVLKSRMAKDLQTVSQLSEDLLRAYRPLAERDEAELKDFVQRQTGSANMNPWDRGYWSTRLLEDQYAFNEMKLREYLLYENVRQGLFDILRQLYGISFIVRRDLPTPAPDIEVYEVRGKDNELFGYVLADPYARETKESGAWMTQLKSSYHDKTGRLPAVVTVNFNFTKPAQGEPFLLTIGEGNTMFHEFGHAVHGLLTQTQYAGQSGTNVKWDFVELPSQFMENFLVEPELLKRFAKHHITGETIPDELIEAFKKSQRFQAGLIVYNQIGLQMLDFAWHTGQIFSMKGTLAEIEREILAPVRLTGHNENISRSTSFTHIFSGGYDAGFYSYKWSEVLAVDAYGIFKNNGLFDSTTAANFYRHILQVGDSVDPLQAFINFAGRPPLVDAMLERDGANPK